MTAAAIGSDGKQRGRRRLNASIVGVGMGVIIVAVGFVIATALHDRGATLSVSALTGRPAPPLAGKTVTGGHASLAGYRGRWVVVNFFASWCVPCQKEAPELARFAHAHRGPTDPAILGVVYQDDDAAAREFIAKYRISWPLLSYSGISARNAYGVIGIPATFLISPDGLIAAKFLGGLRSGQLDTLLARAQDLGQVQALSQVQAHVRPGAVAVATAGTADP